eukprot:CAMPEP_0119112662 /NCGR_PEP_ID=MMETSP1180-20130426/41139_1 /TAXON_ID=3052 ORGANISM="Chlamydomonas cf sp, Strain CCMP681" /NCGR_SAMPLE_ID=MMETSP1180 /ASSEMBLY_ACC=CAM_ASM_000741 /LENGTH=225 /DNA_ID=CAMNT_0007100271 /DNA_START=1 /DNA_END=678 /DNA_ORIENTATION=-
MIVFADVCAAGAQLVQALKADSSSTLQIVPVTVEGLPDLKPLLSSSAPGPPCFLANLQSPAGQVSILCLNTAAGVDTLYLGAAVAAWLQQQSLQRPVVLAAATNLTAVSGKAGPRLLLLNGAAAPQGLAAVPLLSPSTRIKEEQLAVLLHTLSVTGVPTACVLVPGHKPSASGSLRGSQEEVLQLAETLSTAGLLPGAVVCPVRLEELVLLHRWYEGENSDLMYI